MNEEVAKRIHRLVKINLKMENPPDVVKKFVADSIQLDEKLVNLSDKEAIDYLILKDESQHSSSGVVFYLVTSYDNPDNFGRMMRYILGAGVDYWHTILCNLNMILYEVWHLIHLGCKEQLVRLVREAIRQNVRSIENVLMNVFRTINGAGDWQTKVRMMNMLMSTVREHEQWFKSIKSTGLTATIIMVTSHIIVDTPQPITKEDQFKAQLITFLSFVIRSRKIECHALGRDFITVLSRLGRIPQFEEIWKELHQNPANFGVNSIEEFISRPNIVGMLRLSIELQRKIDHIVFHTKQNVIIYYDWLYKSHLRQIDAGSLRAEIIRYLCAITIDPKAHPQHVMDNRIQLLHLIISTAPPGPEQQWLKLSLFIDWFGCDERFVAAANANVEIAISLVKYSLSIQAPPPSQNSIIQASSCSPFANSLLEYLCKSVDVYLPSSSDQIRKNVNTAMRFCRDRFQHGLQQILENYKIDRKIGDMMRNVWPEFMRSAITIGAKKKKTPLATSSVVDEPQQQQQQQQQKSPIVAAASPTAIPPTVGGVFVAEPALTPAEKRKLAEKEELELQSSIKLLKGEIRNKIEQLKSQWKDFSDDADKCEAVESVLTHLCKNDDKLDDSQQEIAAQCLLSIMGSVVVEDKSLLPETNEVAEAFTHPIYSIFKMLCFPPGDEPSASDVMVNLMAAMREKDASLTYVFLYYIKGSDTRTQDSIETYKDVARVSDKNVDEMLAADIQLCALNDNRLFAYLIPFIFSQFEQEVMESTELLNVLCQNLDSGQLRVFISDMIREDIKIFRKDTFTNLVLASVEWSTASQWIFWHLVHADGVAIEWFIQIIPRLETGKHDEAIANILLMLKHMDREPWPGLVRSILSRTPGKDDTFTTDALKVLIDDSDQALRVAELVGGLIKKLIANNEILGLGAKPTTQVGKKAGVAATKVTLQQVLEHLTHFSEACIQKKQRATEGFLSKHYMQEAFLCIKTNDRSSVLTKKYHNLCGTMEVLAADIKEQNSRQLRGNRQGSAAEKTTPTKRKNPENEDDQNSKKRKVQKDVIQLDDSDSD